MSDENLDPEVVCRKLNDALELAYRSALGYTVAGGALQGMQYQGLAVQLVEWAYEELRDAHTIIEKIVGLGASQPRRRLHSNTARMQRRRWQP